MLLPWYGNSATDALLARLVPDPKRRDSNINALINTTRKWDGKPLPFSVVVED